MLLDLRLVIGGLSVITNNILTFVFKYFENNSFFACHFAIFASKYS